MLPVVVDHMGCNANEDINFHFTGFSLSGRVLGAVGGDRCPFQNGGPSNVAVELLSSADDLVSSVFTSSTGEYFFKNVTPDWLSFKSCWASFLFLPEAWSDICPHIVKKILKNLFPSVLLSLSGENGYRNNSKSGVGGHFIFEELFPGSFYIRPLLKEYAFSPCTQTIELGSGEAREVVFEATRVAYSAMGVVTLLSGQPKEGITIEARAESEGYYEETTSDSSGFYRLRGLLPDITYLIKVARKKELGGAGIERASPDSVSMKVGATDPLFG